MPEEKPATEGQDQQGAPSTPPQPQHRGGRGGFRNRPRNARHRGGQEGSPLPEGSPQSNQQERQGQQGNQRSQRPQQGGGIEVSVVIPLYNEEESLKELHQQLRTVLSRIGGRYELLFIDDGSTDRSFQVLRELKRVDHRVKVIRFRRNYGKSAALSVGFDKAVGNYVVTMDSDLQDDPNEIPSLLKRLEDGYDLVSGWKKVRRDPVTKTLPSKFFNFVTGVMTGIRIHDFNCGLKAYKKEVVKSVNVYGELHRYIPVLAHWAGFKVGEMIVHHRPRKYGKTKFGVGRFWKGFLDLLTVLFTTRYMRRPLHLFGFWGIVLGTAGLGVTGWLAVEWYLGHTALSNRPLFVGGIMLMILGVQFVSLGLLGEMISKVQKTGEEYSIRDYIR